MPFALYGTDWLHRRAMVASIASTRDTDVAHDTADSAAANQNPLTLGPGAIKLGEGVLGKTGARRTLCAL
ncbi:MAG: hypothetical protein ABSB35_10555 [Bryobacteraceae bacterium]